MTQHRDTIKTQTTRRTDGRQTVTVKLIGWDPRDLDDLATAIELAYDPAASRVARALRRALDQ